MISRFYHRTARHRSRVHPYYLEPLRSSTVRFQRSFLPRTIRLWNELPSTVFPERYDMSFFKRGLWRVLSGRQRLGSAPGIAEVHGRR